MYVSLIVKDDIKSISGKTTDMFLYVMNAYFSSPIFKVENEDEIQELKDSFLAICTKVRKPMVQIIKGKTEDEFLLELCKVTKKFFGNE